MSDSDDLRMEEVPSQEDLYKILGSYNKTSLEYEKETGEIFRDPVRDEASDELVSRRVVELEKLLDVEQDRDCPWLFSKDENIRTYARVREAEIEGVVFENKDNFGKRETSAFKDLASVFSDVRQNEKENELVNPMADYRVSEALRYFYDTRDDDFDVSEYYDNLFEEDSNDRVVEEARDELFDLNTQYFKIEGFDLEKAAEFIQSLEPEGGASFYNSTEEIDISQYEDEWREYRSQFISQDDPRRQFMDE